MPTNFAIFKKALDNFFIHLTIPRSIVNKYTLQVSRTLKTGKALNRVSNITSPPPPPPQILCLQVSVLIIHLLFKFQMHVHNQHIFELRDDEMNAVEGKLKTTVVQNLRQGGKQGVLSAMLM